MLTAVGIVSKDLERSIEFYKLFGIEFQDFGDGNHFEGKTNGIRIMIDSLELMQKINPGYQMPEGSKLSLCFEFSRPEEVDELFKKIVDVGFSYTKEPWDAFWGQRYACVLDPSGNQIDLFANLEQT